MFSQIAEKASFVNYLPLLTQATSDDGEPTPGYLLEEIRNITFQSVSSSHQLVDYLIHRLNKSCTPVKIKILKIILYLITNGQVSFRQQLRQHDGSVKIAVFHSGPPDPLLGNTLYKDVQRLAQDTLDSMFNPETIKEEEADVDALAPIESPVAFMGGMGSSTRTSGKYEGFGNTAKDREGTVTDKMLDYLGRLIHPSDEQTSEFIRAALHSSPGDYQPVAVAGALIEPVFASELPTPKASPFIKSHVPGRAGGGWESDEDETEENLRNEKGSEFMADISSADLSRDICATLKHQFDLSNDDCCLFEAQEILSRFCKCPGVSSIDELDEACAKCAILGLPQVLQILLKLSNDFVKSSYEEGVMRILLLWEWLYHYDCTVHQALTHDKAEMLDNVVANLELPSACRSKARKLKLIHEGNQSSINYTENVELETNITIPLI